MQAWQSHDLMSSDTHAMDQLQDFLRQRREACEPVADLDAFEQELHRLFVAAEREALGRELSLPNGGDGRYFSFADEGLLS